MSRKVKPAGCTPEALAGLAPGAEIERYGFYGPSAGLVYVGRDNGHVTMRDSSGNEKRVYESLFLKYACIKTDAGGWR